MEFNNKTILLIHGIEGNSEENWFPWFKEEFKAKGYRVIIPNLPNAGSPKLGEWIGALEESIKDFTDELIIVAHSLGAPTACEFIQKNNLRVEKLILVAPTGKNQTEKNWDNLKIVGVGEDEIEIVKSFNNNKLDFIKLNGLIEKTLLYLSNDDPFIPLGIKDNYKKLNPILRNFKGRGHFNSGAGVTEFTEIVNDII